MSHRYKPIYIYTAQNHPKRGKYFGWTFRITRAYQDIRDVVYHTGETGYVRVGEFSTVDRWNLEHYGTEMEQVQRCLAERRARKHLDIAAEQARFAAALKRMGVVQARLERRRKARIRAWNKAQTDYLHGVLATPSSTKQP